MSQHTATDADRRPRQAYWGNRQSVTQFCDYHGLHMSYLPLKARRQPVWKLLEEIQQGIAEIPDTKQLFKLGRVLEQHRLGENSILEDLLWTYGAYRAAPRRSERWWANPSYVHGHEHIDPEKDREAHIKRAINVPFVSLKQVGRRFDTSFSQMRNVVKDMGINFRQQQYESKLAVARSIRCAVEWGDKPAQYYCEQLPAGTTTVRDWYNAVDDFAVPDYPEYSRFHKRPKYREDH